MIVWLALTAANAEYWAYLPPPCGQRQPAIVETPRDKHQLGLVGDEVAVLCDDGTVAVLEYGAWQPVTPPTPRRVQQWLYAGGTHYAWGDDTPVFASTGGAWGATPYRAVAAAVSANGNVWFADADRQISKVDRNAIFDTRDETVVDLLVDADDGVWLLHDSYFSLKTRTRDDRSRLSSTVGASKLERLVGFLDRDVVAQDERGGLWRAGADGWAPLSTPGEGITVVWRDDAWSVSTPGRLTSAASGDRARVWEAPRHTVAHAGTVFGLTSRGEVAELRRGTPPLAGLSLDRRGWTRVDREAETALHVTDLDGDGLDDLLEFGTRAEQTRLLLQRPLLRRFVDAEVSLPKAEVALTCDVDGDGLDEVWLSGRGAPGPDALPIRYFRRDRGDFVESNTWDVGGRIVDAACGDVDRDGDLDVVVASRDRALAVLHNDGLGRFRVVELAPLGGSKDVYGLPAQADTPVSVDLLDLDGDGGSELWIRRNLSDRVLAWQGDHFEAFEDGTGSLAEPLGMLHLDDAGPLFLTQGPGLTAHAWSWERGVGFRNRTDTVDLHTVQQGEASAAAVVRFGTEQLLFTCAGARGARQCHAYDLDRSGVADVTDALPLAARDVPVAFVRVGEEGAVGAILPDGAVLTGDPRPESRTAPAATQVALARVAWVPRAHYGALAGAAVLWLVGVVWHRGRPHAHGHGRPGGALALATTWLATWLGLVVFEAGTVSFALLPAAAGATVLVEGALASHRRRHRVGPYALRELLGEGGMGQVFRAAELATGEEVAVKVLRPGQLATADARERFLDEVRAGGTIRDPRVVGIVASGECPARDPSDPRSTAFLVMELVDGRTLRDVLGRPLPVDIACTIAADIAHGLAVIHAHDLIHRDIKPENVMLTPEGLARVMDLGAVHPYGTSTVTVTDVIGTLPYLAPEQVLSHRAGARCDLYALGVVLFEMLSGRVPREVESLRDIVALPDTPVPSLREVVPGAPPDLVALVDALLEVRPRDRPSSASAVAGRLEALAPRTPYPIVPRPRMTAWSSLVKRLAPRDRVGASPRA
jgi:hypothetical protein